MQYRVEYFAEADYVSGTISGEVNEADLNSARGEMNSTLLDHNCTRLLIDATGLSQMQSLISDFEFTVQHRTGLPPGTRHAVVINPGHKDHMQFVEDVAQNRSVDLMVFTARGEAISWLLGD